MRRWKMMFDRHGDVLRCEQLDGLPCTNGLELIVVEERPVARKGGGTSGGGASPRRPTLPGGDALPVEQRESVAAPIDPARELEPLVA